MDPEPVAAFLGGLAEFERQVRQPIVDLTKESPDIALESLRSAIATSPATYRDYLDEAIACYEGGQLRAAVLMVWAATMQHLYVTAQSRHKGVSEIERANFKRYGASKSYRRLTKVDDFQYLKESQFLLLAEDAGMYSKSTRTLLEERLGLRNRCGHPTGYRPGRGEVVVFVESLLQNILSGHLLNW